MSILALAMLLTGVLMPLVIGATLLLARHWYRRRDDTEPFSPVTRQHLNLFQGGQLSETAVELAKERIQELLDRGEVEAVEASLRPGMQYVVQVRALAEIGTEEAGSILERQLQRRLTSDQLEQSWYWIDLATSLRSLNREESLPHLLRCAQSAGASPLSHFLAAETACFLGFSGYVRQLDGALGKAALKVLHQVLEGLRQGLQPHVVAEARLGEILENLWDHRPEAVNPVVVRIFAEALRLLRRAPHARACMDDDPSDFEAFQWQVSRLAALEPVLSDYLHEAPQCLCEAVPQSQGDEQRETVLALLDLKAEAAPVLIPLLEQGKLEPADLAVEVLTWSRDPRTGFWLREWAGKKVPMDRRSLRRRRALPPLRRTLPAGFPYEAVLRSLRGHPSGNTEAFLVLASRDFDPAIRAAAVGSLGWWEPLHRYEVHGALEETRRDGNADVRRGARAALARLGERQSLQWFRQLLTNDDMQRVHEGVHWIAAEGLVLLWPDLDRLADSDDPELAYHARESLERLSEDMSHPWRQR